MEASNVVDDDEGCVDGPGMSIIGTGAGGGAVTLVSKMPTPSIIPNKTPPKIADFIAERRPVLSWRTPPVNAAALMLFQGSSAGVDWCEHDCIHRHCYYYE